MTNFIRTRVDKELGVVTVSIYLDGEEKTWINYDRKQIKGLIKLLQDADKEINDNFQNTEI